MKLRLTIASLFLMSAAQAQTVTAAEQEKINREKSELAFHKDWANVMRYDASNQQLNRRPTDTPKGAVYMGDSITDAWIRNDATFFDGNDYLDRGISGQTTTQMLVRFRKDVIDLKPKVVLILAGINDIAENNGPIKLEDVAGNIQSMAILARSAGIKVILCSVLPANRFPWRPEISPADKVIRLNDMLQAYAKKNNMLYLDYYTAMVDGQKGLPTTLSADGVHPNLAGYKIMEPLAVKAIAQALKQ